MIPTFFGESTAHIQGHVFFAVFLPITRFATFVYHAGLVFFLNRRVGNYAKRVYAVFPISPRRKYTTSIISLLWIQEK